MARAFRERLRRLRREQDVAPAGEARELPVWLRRKLDRGRRPEVGVAAGHARSLGEPHGLVEHPGPAGAWCSRESFFPAGTLHGSATLEDARSVGGEAFELLTGGRTRADFDVTRAVYLDIETTGLSGGAGTHTYMVGLGWFEPEGLRVRQAFLRGPEEERALLVACAETIAASSGLVSFFGKSFDRHRLEDKMRLHGVPAPFEGLPHLDLYWPCRRLYGAATADTRLNTMERELCGVRRADDLPGSFAPAAWFDFLAGRAHLLEHVFRHNLDDVLSLVALMEHVGRALEECDAGGESWSSAGALDAARACAWMRTLGEQRRHGDALAWGERALERVTGEQARRRVRMERAQLLVRNERSAEALGELRALAEGGRDALSARAAVEATLLGWRVERDVAASLAALPRARERLELTCTGRERTGLSARLDTLARRCRRAAARAAGEQP